MVSEPTFRVKFSFFFFFPLSLFLHVHLTLSMQKFCLTSKRVEIVSMVLHISKIFHLWSSVAPFVFFDHGFRTWPSWLGLGPIWVESDRTWTPLIGLRRVSWVVLSPHSNRLGRLYKDLLALKSSFSLQEKAAGRGFLTLILDIEWLSLVESLGFKCYISCNVHWILLIESQNTIKTWKMY